MKTRINENCHSFDGSKHMPDCPQCKKEKTSHTPGPWKVGPEYYDNPQGDMKAVFCGSFADTATSVARHCKPEDARLIAAAPELLELIKEVKRDIADVAQSAIDGSRAEALFTRIEKAIAKAEGK